MIQKTYSEKLKDPRWQKKRLEVMQRDEFSCQMCGDEESILNVHHLSYRGEPWETPQYLLTTLCEDCHKKEEENLKSAHANLIKTIKFTGFSSRALSDLNEVIEKNSHFIGFINWDVIDFFINNASLMAIATKMFEDEINIKYLEERIDPEKHPF